MCRLGKLTSRSRFGVQRTKYRGNYLACGFKCSRSYSEALETLISLRGWGVMAKNRPRNLEFFQE